MKPITVLSLFDGMSCGQIALERAGIPVKKYYASEIDKYAIQITQKNYPNTIQLGDIQNWKTWKIDVPDLIIAGSPCQGFSNAGLGLNFDDPRSKLFFTFCDILAHWSSRNPDLKYLLENVKMKRLWQDIITDRIKVEPVMIDSALVSAQSRKRLYWANWKISQPENKGILLKDIIECGEVNRDKSYAIDANYFKGGNPRSYFEDGQIQVAFAHQSHRKAMVFVGGLEKGRRLRDGKSLSRNYREGYRVYSAEGKAASLTSMPKGGPGGYTGIYQVGLASDIKGYDIKKRVYGVNGKSPSILSNNAGGAIPPKIEAGDYHYRKLTPLECERLQTVPEGYTEGVSNTQRYKILGNGWTVDVIVGILLQME